MSRSVRAPQYQDARELFEEFDIAGKGRGLRALGHISKGTCVLAETPVFSSNGFNFHKPIVDFYIALQNPDRRWSWELDAHESERLKELTEFRSRRSWSEIPKHFQHIFCVYWANEIEGRVFRQSTLINHSCDPNLVYVWDSNRRAYDIIQSYVFASLEERNFFLAEKYGFECTCGACTDKLAALNHDEKAAQFEEGTDFFDRQEEHPEHADWAKCKKIAIKLADLFTSKPSLLCLRAYRRVAKFNWYLGEPRNTAHWIDCELKMQEISISPHHPAAKRIHQIREKVRLAMEDQSSYENAKGKRPSQDLLDLSNTCPPVELYGAKARFKAHGKSSTRDWRLDHCLKARWWAQIEMEQESREHPDFHHVAVDVLVEHARYMQEFADSSESRYYPTGPYADTEKWFESDTGKVDAAVVEKLTKNIDEERAERLGREMREDMGEETIEDMGGETEEDMAEEMTNDDDDA